MKRRVLFFLVVVAMLCPQGIGFAQSGGDEAQALRDLLTSCDHPCFEGIELDASTKADVSNIFAALGIEPVIDNYNNAAIWQWSSEAARRFAANEMHPGGGFITFHGEIVRQITVAIEVDPATVIEVFGAPDAVVERRSTNGSGIVDFEFVYADERLIFSTSSVSDYQIIDSVVLVSAESKDNQIESLLAINASQPCVNYGISPCLVPTATSFPAPTTVPTPTPSGTRQGFVDLAWSPNSDVIAVAKKRGIMQLLDATTQEPLVTFGEEGESILVIAWSPDGHRLASGGWDGIVHLWDVANGQLLATLSANVDRVTGIQWTSDGNRLIVSGFESGYQVWNASTYEFINRFVGYSYSTALNPDNTLLAEAAAGGVVIRNVETGEYLTPFRGHIREVMGVDWSPDGTRLVSGGWDGTVRTWDAVTHQALLVLSAHAGIVPEVHWSPDGTRIVSSGSDGVAHIWDANTGACLMTIDHPGPMDWSPDGTQLAYGGEDGTLHFVDVP
jgi:WD40 repeat protein